MVGAQSLTPKVVPTSIWFRKKHSTTDVIAIFTSDGLWQWTTKNMPLIYLSKAFDTIGHAIHYGIQDVNYPLKYPLANRLQYVHYTDTVYYLFT